MWQLSTRSHLLNISRLTSLAVRTAAQNKHKKRIESSFVTLLYKIEVYHLTPLVDKLKIEETGFQDAFLIYLGEVTNLHSDEGTCRVNQTETH